MCILCGCDYCESIRGIGQVKAYQFIQKYKSIEKVIENLTDKYQVCISCRVVIRFLRIGLISALVSYLNLLRF